MERSIAIMCLLWCLITMSALAEDRYSGRIDVPPPEIESLPLQIQGYRSSFLVPVSVTASRLALMINEQAPKRFDGTQGLDIGGEIHGERLHYTIHRGDVSVRANNDRVHFTVPLSGHATAKAEVCPLGTGFVCFDVQETAEIRATINATLSDIQIDSDWKPYAKLERLDVHVTKAEAELLGFITISFRSILTKELNRALPRLIGVLEDIPNKLDISSMLQSVWDSMHRTIQLSDNPDTWLSVKPAGLGLSPLTAANDLISASVALSSDVAIHFGAEPAIEQRPMRREQIQPDAVPTFRLRAPVTADLNDLAAYLNNRYSPLDTRHRGAVVTLSNLTLAEYKGRLLLGADFSISGWIRVRGTVYALVTPVLDENTLRLEEFELSVESRNILTELVAGLLRPVIARRLQNRLQIDLATYYRKATVRLNSTVEALEIGRGVNLKVDVGGVRLIDVVAGAGMLTVVAEVTGVATIEVEHP